MTQMSLSIKQKQTHRRREQTCGYRRGGQGGRGMDWEFGVGQFSSAQLLSHVWLFATPWTAAHQASLSITNTQSLLKLMSIKLMMPSSHLILCHPLLLLPPVFPSIKVFSSESVLHIRWPEYWSFSFSIRPFNEYVYSATLEPKKYTKKPNIWRSLKSRTMPRKVRRVKAMVFPVVMYGCESGTIKKIWENGIETCIISYKKWIASLGSMQDTGGLGLVHWNNPEGWYGEEGGRGV